MEGFTISSSKQGGAPEITRGITVMNRNRIALGSIDMEVIGTEHLPLSEELQNALNDERTLTNASVMRSPTSIKFLAVENIEKDKAGAVLVRINVAPPEGQTTIITKAETSTQKCSFQGWKNPEPKSCESCQLEYVPEDSDSTGFIHPNSGHTRTYSEHLPHHVKVVSEAPHLNEGHLTHKEMVVILEPGARLRVATMAGVNVVSEHVLVRTHTELAFAAPGEIYLASELKEANAAYL